MERSDEINELVAALAKAHMKFKPVLRKATNPYYGSQYAELEDYIDATALGLSENGLAVIQIPVYNPEETGVIVTTIVAHSTGQWMLERLWMPVTKADAQGIGSAITYGRRYSYGAMLNIASRGEDDDGAAAVGHAQEDRGAKTTDKDEKKGAAINAAQVRALWAAMGKTSKTKTQLREFLEKKYRVFHTADILKKDFDDILRWVVGPAVPAEGEDMTQALKASLPQREPGDDDEVASPPLDFKR